MCGRYKIEERIDFADLRGIIDQVNRRGADAPVKTSGEIFPTDIVPVVAHSRRGASGAFAMRWGYELPDGRRVINARSETAAIRPLFRDGMLKRRCAVPATHYFEWARVGGRRIRYAIRPAGSGLFYMAGVYRAEADGPAFSILTRDPAESIAFIHDRMPVILPSELVEDWLDPRYSAGELLGHAVLDVSHEQDREAEQLQMEF